MDITQIIAAAGGASKLAKRLNCHHSTVLEWTRVPASRLESVAKITGIPPHELRPDLAKLFSPGAAA